jgi:hypothetical protein
VSINKSDKQTALTRVLWERAGCDWVVSQWSRAASKSRSPAAIDRSRTAQGPDADPIFIFALAQARIANCDCGIAKKVLQRILGKKREIMLDSYAPLIHAATRDLDICKQHGTAANQLDLMHSDAQHCVRCDWQAVLYKRVGSRIASPNMRLRNNRKQNFSHTDTNGLAEMFADDNGSHLRMCAGESFAA